MDIYIFGVAEMDPFFDVWTVARPSIEAQDVDNNCLICGDPGDISTTWRRLLLLEVSGFSLLGECLCSGLVSVDHAWVEILVWYTKVGLANLEQLEYLLPCHGIFFVELLELLKMGVKYQVIFSLSPL